MRLEEYVDVASPTFFKVSLVPTSPTSRFPSPIARVSKRLRIDSERDAEMEAVVTEVVVVVAAVEEEFGEDDTAAAWANLLASVVTLVASSTQYHPPFKTRMWVSFKEAMG